MNTMLVLRRAAGRCSDGERNTEGCGGQRTAGSRTRLGPGMGRRDSIVIVAVLPGMQQRLPVLFSLQDVVDAGVRVGDLQDPEMQVLETGIAVVANQLAQALVPAMPIGRVLAPATPEALLAGALPT